MFRHLDPTMRAALFLLGTLTLGYAPGALVLHLLKRSLTPLEHVSLSLTLGLVTSAALYWVMRTAGAPALFMAWPVATTGLLLYLRRPRVRLKPDTTWEWSHAALLAVIAVGVFVMVRLPLFFGNLTVAPHRGLSVVPIGDPLLHVAIAHELTHTIPPQNPVFAGAALGYHYGADLVTAMMASTTGLAVADLTVRFVPILLVVVSMLAVFCFSRRWLGSNGFAALTVFLVFFGEDLAFVPGLMRGWEFDWTTAFNVPSVFSLFHLNPMLPGLGLLFSGFFLLQKYSDEPDYRWLMLSAGCIAVLAEIKVFTVAHVLGSLWASALVFAVFARRFELLKVTIVTSVLAAALLANTMWQNQTVAHIDIMVGQAGYIDGAMRRLGIGESAPGRSALLMIGLPLFLIASLGLRVVGAWAIVTALVRPIANEPLRFMLAFFVVTGIIVTLMTRIVAEGHGYDNGVWFFVHSKFVAWVFAAEVLRRWYERLRSRRLAPVLAGIVIGVPAIAIAAPSTVQHFVVLSKEAAVNDPEATAAARFIAARALPGDVLLANQPVMARALALAPVRVPIGYFADSMVPQDEYKRREALVLAFWRDWESGTVRTDVLRDLHVRFVAAVRPGELSLPPGVKELYAKSAYVVLQITE